MIIIQIKCVRFAHLLVSLAKTTGTHAHNAKAHKIEVWVGLLVIVFQDIMIRVVIFVNHVHFIV